MDATCKFLNIQVLNLFENQKDNEQKHAKKTKPHSSVDMSINNIYSVDHVKDLSYVRKVNLSNNKLNILPLSICDMKNLTCLNLSDNSFNVFPREVECLINLEYLYIANNGLEYLPESLGQLKKLCGLDFSHNKLECVPQCFENLFNLTMFNLSHNKFSQVPDCIITSMNNLRILNFSHNQLENFIKPSSAWSLVHIDISYNKLLHIPQWLFEGVCRHLVYLNLCHNVNMKGQSTKAPYERSLEALSTSVNLKYLNVNDCEMNISMNTFLQGLRNLHILKMGNLEQNSSQGKAGNIFMSMPMNILFFSNLQQLEMSGVYLVELPDNIDRFSNLEILDVSHNDISWFPDNIIKLPKLKILRASSNKIMVLPLNLKYLKNLKELMLGNNKLQTLPSDFVDLNSLEVLDLYDNLLGSTINFENFERLTSLDLEYNKFLTNDLFNSKSHVTREKYDLLRDHLRIQVDPNNLRICGVRQDITPDDSESEESFDEDIGQASYSSIEESWDDTHNEAATLKGLNGVIAVDSSESENWDDEMAQNTPSDSDSLFDPTDSRKRVCPVPCSSLQQLINVIPYEFCPADMHVASIRRFYKERKNNIKSYVSVPGQFDDVNIE